MDSMHLQLVVLSVLAITTSAGLPSTSPPTVSGISAGGYMAVQLQVAFSETFSGAGVIAGGPFYCAQANLPTALSSCMTSPALISVAELATITRSTVFTGTIDPVRNLESHRVYLFSGTQDTVVHPGVMSKLNQYYLAMGVLPENIASQFSIPAEHAFVTADFGNNCSFKGPPYMNNCNFDSAGAILHQLYPGQIQPPQPADPRRVLGFSQSKFLEVGYTLVTAALSDEGYVYMPSGCDIGKCALHVALHGCLQDWEVNNGLFVNHTYNDWAEANQMIVLYPQARRTAVNPKGCFDWWGYTGVDYACKLGAQMRAVKNMVDHFNLAYGST